MSRARSEYGRGYATCLRQFVNHRKRLAEQVDLWGDMRARHPGMFDDGSAVETWANGASDHLYELVKPKRGVPAAEWQRARIAADRALDIGHGFRPRSKSDPAEATALLDAAAACLDALTARGHAVATLDDAMATDRALGLSPDAGRWSCALDLERRT